MSFEPDPVSGPQGLPWAPEADICHKSRGRIDLTIVPKFCSASGRQSKRKTEQYKTDWKAGNTPEAETGPKRARHWPPCGLCGLGRHYHRHHPPPPPPTHRPPQPQRLSIPGGRGWVSGGAGARGGRIYFKLCPRRRYVVECLCASVSCTAGPSIGLHGPLEQSKWPLRIPSCA